MKIFIQCECGRTGNVDALMVGKTIICPSCKGHVLIKPQSAAPAAQPPNKKKNETIPIFHMSSGMVTLLVLVIVGILFAQGPVRVWHQWDAISGAAEDRVKDVIAYGLQCVLSNTGEYDPNTGRDMPAVNGDVDFSRPLLVMSMPETVKFSGATNEGNFVGYYHPATGEIEADVTYGSRTVMGMIHLTKTTASFHLTGREKDGKLTAETNGKPATIYYPPKPEKLIQ